MFIFLLWIFSKKKVLALGLIMVTLASLWLIAPQQTKDRFLTFTETSRVVTEGRSTFVSDEESAALGSMATRYEMLKNSIQIFFENPLIGVGIGCYGSYSGRHLGTWFPPHNTYSQMLAEFGIIGSVPFLLVIFFTLKSIRESKTLILKMNRENSFLSIGVSATFSFYVVYLVTSFFGIELYSNFWWFAGGLSVAILRICKKEHLKSEKNSSFPFNVEERGVL
jgi:O-antigen ligase